jgi:alpha-beta hydrolase superfamily lysophospholipase
MPIRRDDSFVDAYGVRIHYHVWERTQPRAVIQIVHGLGEHALRYEEVAAAFVAAGFSVWADEHRGHGPTGMEQYGGDRSKLGRLGRGGHRATVEEVHRLGQMAREANPGVPFVLLGQSWGSLIAQILLNDHPEEYSAVVLSASAYRTLTDMRGGDLNARHAHLGTTGYEWLSRDPVTVARAAEDLLMFKATALKLFGLADTLRLLGKPRKRLAEINDVPLLLIAGSDDSLGGEQSVAKLASAYVARSGLTDVTAIIYPGARHEVLNETNRDEVIADVIAFIDAHL